MKKTELIIVNYYIFQKNNKKSFTNTNLYAILYFSYVARQRT